MEKETLQHLIEIARYAPTGSNSQLVEWTVFTDKEKIHKLAGLTVDWLKYTKENDPASARLPYIPLIIVNCIIICRCEVCASKQGVVTAASDAIGQALGFGLALSSIAAVREILGTGMLFGIRVMPAAWPDWVIMVLPPGAFITLGLLLGCVNWIGILKARRSANE